MAAPENKPLLPSAAAMRTQASLPSHSGSSDAVLDLRRDVWTVLRYRSSIAHRTSLQKASYLVELGVLTLIVMNVLLVLYQSSVAVDNVVVADDGWDQTFLVVSTAIFTVEYLLRLWSCVEDERYTGAVVGRCVFACCFGNSRPLCCLVYC